MALHAWSPKLTAWIARPLNLLAGVLLLGVFALVLVVRYELLAQIQPRGWAGMSLLLLASLACGWFCGGADMARRKALAVTTAIRNVGVALVIVSGNLAETAALTAVVAYAVVSILGGLAAALVFAKFPRPAPTGRVPVV